SKPEAEPEPPSRPQPVVLPLSIRASEHQLQSRIELLALLSNAADQIGDWNQAAEFERARLGLLAGAEARRDSRSRIERLLAKQKGVSRDKRLLFTVSESVVSLD